jgi:hypothetical protein
LAAALAAPILAVTPASAAILFSCSALSATASLTPGISHTPTAQTDVSGTASLSGCSNGETGSIGIGAGAGHNAVTTFPPRPIGCPVAAGGAGPDYPENTPILSGPDPSFGISWSLGGSSTGILKAKAGPVSAPNEAKVVLVITAGKYAPPAGKKTKIKGPGAYLPLDSFSCTDDSDPLTSVSISNSASWIVQQK